MILETWGKKLVQKFISSRDGSVKIRKPGKDENMQEDCPTAAAYTVCISIVLMQQMLGSLLVILFFHCSVVG